MPHEMCRRVTLPAAVQTPSPYIAPNVLVLAEDFLKLSSKVIVGHTPSSSGLFVHIKHCDSVDFATCHIVID